jgi:hypothetical protein
MGLNRSSQTCAVFVEGEDAPHPDAVRMAEVMREKKASEGACLFMDLIRAGFSAPQISEHHPQAQRLASEAEVTQVAGARVDRCADVLHKARSPMPNRPPMMAGVDAAALHSAWGDYCSARAALRLDPWSGQRERALQRLEACLKLLPILKPDCARILRETGNILAFTPQGSLFATTGKARTQQVHA